jgi:hypothetical protein
VNGSGGGAVAPPLRFEALAVRARPIQRKPFFLKEFGQDDVSILNDPDFDGHLVRVQDAAHICRATSQAPKHACAGLNGVCRHVWRCVLYANRNYRGFA